MKRKNDTIICKECGFETKVNGISVHIKSKHNLTVDEYVDKWRAAGGIGIHHTSLSKTLKELTKYIK
jgi:predicted transcriptional regulator